VIVPATVAFAAGCRAEISNMAAPAPPVPRSSRGTWARPRRQAMSPAPRPPTRTSRSAALASTPFDSDSLDPRTPCCRGWAARYASAGTTRPGRVRKASSRKEVSPG